MNLHKQCNACIFILKREKLISASNREKHSLRITQSCHYFQIVVDNMKSYKKFAVVLYIFAITVKQFQCQTGRPVNRNCQTA